MMRSTCREYAPMELATVENTVLEFDPIMRSVPTTIIRITATITAYSAMSCQSSDQRGTSNWRIGGCWVSSRDTLTLHPSRRSIGQSSLGPGLRAVLPILAFTQALHRSPWGGWRVVCHLLGRNLSINSISTKRQFMRWCDARGRTRVLEYRSCPPTQGCRVLRQRAVRVGSWAGHWRILKFAFFSVSESRSGSWLQEPAQPAKTISLDDIYHGAKISGIGWRRGMAGRRVGSISPKRPQVSS